ncbi:MAG: SLBB domain-containing protein [Gammaproteobacteria bacterium]|nr:SLBB domain-containing protein [Gammaproteobacteria bacterium]
MLRKFLASLSLIVAFIGAPAHAAAPLSAADAQEMSAIKAPLLQLGPGDSVTIDVYGQRDMSGTVYVSDDGTIPVALAGPVQVAGLSPAQAAARIEKALRDGKFLVDPHVTVAVTESRSQRVSVFGQVGKPGRYAIESNTSIFDLIAEAGGVTEKGGDTVYLLRQGADGKVGRFPVSLKGVADGAETLPGGALKGGDSIYVPHAPQFYIYGEVTKPGQYTVENGMTVIQAIASAGGITPRGSEHRVVVKRRGADGKYTTERARLGDLVQPDDVIRVKESIF